jgi:hypothetical protein
MYKIRNKKKTLLETIKKTITFKVGHTDKTITFDVDLNIYKVTYQRYGVSSTGVKGWSNYSSYSLSTDKYEVQTDDKNIDLTNDLINFHKGFFYNPILKTYFKKVLL